MLGVLGASAVRVAFLVPVLSLLYTSVAASNTTGTSTDPCAAVPCGSGQTCVTNPSGYGFYCKCFNGTAQVEQANASVPNCSGGGHPAGPGASAADPCASTPCGSGQTCEGDSTGGGFRCKCFDGKTEAVNASVPSCPATSATGAPPADPCAAAPCGKEQACEIVPKTPPEFTCRCDINGDLNVSAPVVNCPRSTAAPSNSSWTPHATSDDDSGVEGIVIGVGLVLGLALLLLVCVAKHYSTQKKRNRDLLEALTPSRREITVTRNDAKEKLGIELNEDMVVQRLARNGPMYRAGVRPQMKVLAVDSQVVTSSRAMKRQARRKMEFTLIVNDPNYDANLTRESTSATRAKPEERESMLGKPQQKQEMRVYECPLMTTLEALREADRREVEALNTKQHPGGCGYCNGKETWGLKQSWGPGPVLETGEGCLPLTALGFTEPESNTADGNVLASPHMSSRFESKCTSLLSPTPGFSNPSSRPYLLVSSTDSLNSDEKLECPDRTTRMDLLLGSPDVAVKTTDL